MRPSDTVALVTMLRRICARASVRKVFAGGIQYSGAARAVPPIQRRQDRFPGAWARRFDNIKLGTVDVKHLAQKHGEIGVPDRSDQERDRAGGDHPDAVIFAGPKLMLDDSVPDEPAPPFATDVDFPVFYVNYNLYPQELPWKDSVSHAVKLFRGTEYYHQPPARSVVRGHRDGVAYSKIQTWADTNSVSSQ